MNKEQALKLIDLYSKYPASPSTVRNIIDRFPEDGSEKKSMRWLGYCQGVLVSTGVFNLDEVKDHSRAISSGEEVVLSTAGVLRTLKNVHYPEWSPDLAFLLHAHGIVMLPVSPAFGEHMFGGGPDVRYFELSAQSLDLEKVKVHVREVLEKNDYVVVHDQGLEPNQAKLIQLRESSNESVNGDTMVLAYLEEPGASDRRAVEIFKSLELGNLQ